MRRKKGYTQKDVSGRSGLSIFTISTFESGASVGLTMATYLKLLYAIDCAILIESPDKMQGQIIILHTGHE